MRTWRGHRRGGTEPPTRAGRRQQTKRQQTRLATERHRTRPDAPYSLPSTPLCYTRRAIILPPKRMPTKASMVGHPIYSEPWVQRLDWTAFASELKESMEASAEACLQEQIDKATTFGMEDIATALSTIQTQLSSPTWLPSQKHSIGEHVAKLLAQIAQGGLAGRACSQSSEIQLSPQIWRGSHGARRSLSWR